MKESYHICFTSHDEVLFRDNQDHGVFVNLMAVRGFALETEILADAEMSTHAHLNLFTEVPLVYAGQLRSTYTKYFNHKYGRKGRFGQKYTFLQKVDGLNHQVVLLNYIKRNGLHHGAAATAFGYAYCSVREPFAKDMGFGMEKAASLSRQEIASFLPRKAQFPDHYQMTEQGVFLRQSFMEVRRVEQFYVSPRNYLFQMNRLTDESWIQEQMRDNTGAPITLSQVEQADEKTLAQLLNNEHGRSFNRSRMQDMDVCALIDLDFLPGYGVSSVYVLTETQKRRIARTLFNEYHLSMAQISRCLVLGC